MLSRQATINSNISLDDCPSKDKKKVAKEEPKNNEEKIISTAAGASDWGPDASSTSHIFLPSSGGVETCYIGQDCGGAGTRLSCVACKVRKYLEL